MRSVDRTVAHPVRVEIPKIKGSRFIADLAPARSPTEADAIVERVRADMPDARHHCFAWRVGSRGDTFRFSDDGEPGGTAGRPILQHLEGEGVTNAVLVVTRYFGGTKLGVGGLIRAYGAAAALALETAELIEEVERRAIEVRVRYEDSAALHAVSAGHELEPTTSEYGEHVRASFSVPVQLVDAFVRELRDRTAGRADISIVD